jgi:hypothetical protein
VKGLGLTRSVAYLVAGFLSDWWAHQDLNLEPKRYEHSALTN